MKLSDVMSAMHLSSYAEVGLVLFLLAFILVSFDLLKKKDLEFERFRQLPLGDEPEQRSKGERAS